MTHQPSQKFQDYIKQISPNLRDTAIAYIAIELHTFTKTGMSPVQAHEIEELAHNAVLNTILMLGEDELHKLDHIEEILAGATHDAVFSFLVEKGFDDLEAKDLYQALVDDELANQPQPSAATVHPLSDKLMAQFEKAANFLKPKEREFLYGIIEGNNRTKAAKDAGMTGRYHADKVFRSRLFGELYEIAVSHGADELAEFLKENAKEHGGEYQEKIAKAPLASTHRR